jgi:hypothetical protein
MIWQELTSGDFDTIERTTPVLLPGGGRRNPDRSGYKTVTHSLF